MDSLMGAELYAAMEKEKEDPEGEITLFVQRNEHGELTLEAEETVPDSDSEDSEIIPLQGPPELPALCPKPECKTGMAHTPKIGTLQLTCNSHFLPRTLSTPLTRNGSDNINGIIIQSVKTSAKRDYTKKHSCFFCQKTVNKMARHLEKAHGDNEEIKNLPKPSKNNTEKRKAIFNKYRNLGDFNHNVSVLLKKEGIFFVGRRPSDKKTISPNDYLPCQFCLTFFVRGELWRHVAKCDFKKDKISVQSPENAHAAAVRSSEYMLQGAIGAEAYSSDDIEFHNVILNRFHKDKISLAVKNDSLLLLFGKVQLRKLGLQRASQVREKLRILGRLKLELRSLTNQEFSSMDDFITPTRFDLCTKAVNIIAEESSSGSSTGSKTYGKPSLALKAGQLLKKMAVMKRGRAIRNLDIQQKAETDHFISLYDEEFSDAIASLAHHSLSERKYNKKVLLPFTEDLLHYVKYLETSMVDQTRELVSAPNHKIWNSLAEVTIARVILFNKRRSSEGSKMLVSQFVGRPAWGKENKELVASLKPMERHLMKKMSLVEVVGKQYKRVPVLLTPTMVQAIQALVDLREDGGVKMSNPHVFAQGEFNTKRGSDCIRQTVKKCKLQFPERITSTKLRKYLATVSQVFNLSESDLGELARHMGHELSVHRRFYRLQDDVIELAKVSRLLLSVEEGTAAKFTGKGLDDINLEDFGKEGEEECEEKEEEEEEHEPDLDEPMEEGDIVSPSVSSPSPEKTKTEDEPMEEGDIVSSPVVVFPSVSSPPREKTKTEESKGQRTKWTDDERTALRGLVKNLNNKPPTKQEILQLKIDHKIFKNREWKSIKYYAWSLYQQQQKKKKAVISKLFN